MSIMSWFKRRRAEVPAADERPTWTPERIEELIDDAGREEVFAAARALGWGPGDTPPLWVWAGIAREVKSRKPEAARVLH